MSLMTILVHKIHIKTYGSIDRLWSKNIHGKTFILANFSPQDITINFIFDLETILLRVMFRSKTHTCLYHKIRGLHI